MTSRMPYGRRWTRDTFSSASEQENVQTVYLVICDLCKEEKTVGPRQGQPPIPPRPQRRGSPEDSDGRCDQYDQ
jgi:hypothetical protein